jgi:hypothetical protein
MQFRFPARILLTGVLSLGVAIPGFAEQAARAATSQQVRITGVVRDDSNAITLPGIPVEVVGTSQTVYTDVDGRFVIDVPPGDYQLKVTMEGYQERLVNVTAPAGQRTVTANIGMTMSAFAETVTVTALAPLDASTSTREAQLIERRNAPVITDNLGAQEM